MRLLACPRRHRSTGGCVPGTDEIGVQVPVPAPGWPGSTGELRACTSAMPVQFRRPAPRITALSYSQEYAGLISRKARGRSGGSHFESVRLRRRRVHPERSEGLRAGTLRGRVEVAVSDERSGESNHPAEGLGMRQARPVRGGTPTRLGRSTRPPSAMEAVRLDEDSALKADARKGRRFESCSLRKNSSCVAGIFRRAGP